MRCTGKHNITNMLFDILCQNSWELWKRRFVYSFCTNNITGTGGQEVDKLDPRPQENSRTARIYKTKDMTVDWGGLAPHLNDNRLYWSTQLHPIMLVVLAMVPSPYSGKNWPRQPEHGRPLCSVGPIWARMSLRSREQMAVLLPVCVPRIETR